MEKAVLFAMVLVSLVAMSGMSYALGAFDCAVMAYNYCSGSGCSNGEFWAYYGTCVHPIMMEEVEVTAER